SLSCKRCLRHPTTPLRPLLSLGRSRYVVPEEGPSASDDDSAAAPVSWSLALRRPGRAAFGIRRAGPAAAPVSWSLALRRPGTGALGIRRDDSAAAPTRSV